jgi:hypothetical protein
LVSRWSATITGAGNALAMTLRPIAEAMAQADPLYVLHGDTCEIVIEWGETGDRRSVKLTFVFAGDYTFCVPTPRGIEVAPLWAMYAKRNPSDTYDRLAGMKLAGFRALRRATAVRAEHKLAYSALRRYLREAVETAARFDNKNEGA